MSYFALREWDFDTTNVENLFKSLNENDQKEFPFDMHTIDWEKFMGIKYLGMRRYIVKEDDKTIPYSLKKMNM